MTLLTEKIFLLFEPEFYANKIDLVKTTPRRNLYPDEFVEGLINSVLFNHANTNNQCPTETFQWLKSRKFHYNYNIPIGNANHSALCKHAIEHRNTH